MGLYLCDVRINVISFNFPLRPCNPNPVIPVQNNGILPPKLTQKSNKQSIYGCIQGFMLLNYVQGVSAKFVLHLTHMVKSDDTFLHPCSVLKNYLSNICLMFFLMPL